MNVCCNACNLRISLDALFAPLQHTGGEVKQNEPTIPDQRQYPLCKKASPCTCIENILSLFRLSEAQCYIVGCAKIVCEFVVIAWCELIICSPNFPIERREHHRLRFFIKSEFPTTLTLLSAIAPPAMIGLSIHPVRGYSTPAATGIPRTL